MQSGLVVVAQLYGTVVVHTMNQVQSDQLIKEIPSSAPGMYVYRSI